jgi:hypothetical protein
MASSNSKTEKKSILDSHTRTLVYSQSNWFCCLGKWEQKSSEKKRNEKDVRSYFSSNCVLCEVKVSMKEKLGSGE